MTALARHFASGMDEDAPPVPVHGTTRFPARQPRPIVNAALAVKIAAAVIAPLLASLAVLAGIGSFATIRHLAVPWFGSTAWIVPVGIDIGILALLACDLLIEYLGFPWPVLRWTAWAFIAATVYLNIAAAHGDPNAAVMHAAMPVLFVTVMEGIRYLIRQWTGLATGTRIEHIPASRWLLAPRSSFLLARRMILWQVTSYRRALALEHQRLQAVSRLQETYGRYLWRWKAPLSELIALRLASAEVSLDLAPFDEDSCDDQDARRDLPGQPPSAATLLSHLPQQCLIEPPKTRRPSSNPDRALIAAATEILREAERQGDRISQATLARKLRERGHRVANERLRWLVTAVQRMPMSDGAS